uniref:Uncharacterized protein n=1 Tax=Micrurus corallinus TaxID=54390 RepID=A0A2D4GWA7_MICCO
MTLTLHFAIYFFYYWDSDLLYVGQKCISLKWCTKSTITLNQSNHKTLKINIWPQSVLPCHHQIFFQQKAGIYKPYGRLKGFEASQCSGGNVCLAQSLKMPSTVAGEMSRNLLSRSGVSNLGNPKTRGLLTPRVPQPAKLGVEVHRS